MKAARLKLADLEEAQFWRSASPELDRAGAKKSKARDRKRQAANSTFVMRPSGVALRECGSRNHLLEYQIKAGRLSAVRLALRCIGISPIVRAAFLERSAA